MLMARDYGKSRLYPHVGVLLEQIDQCLWNSEAGARLPLDF